MENESKKRTLIYVIIAMVLGALVGTFAATLVYKQQSVAVNIDNGTSDAKLNAIWDLVERKYVDRIDADSVMDKVYEAMLTTLDPHSVYLSGKRLESEKEAIRGNFDGVGILISKHLDTVCVAQIIPGGPSERAGLQACDRILKVDGKDVVGKNIPVDSVVTLLRGPSRSKVELTIGRYGDPKPHIVTVVRGTIPTPSVTYSGMIDKTTGFVRIDRFSETTYREFYEAVSALKQQGMKSLVIDLRDNGGGLMSEAINICDELLPGREMIVYTEGAHQRRQETHSRPGGIFCKGKLTIMIDEYSASASEIVAGAIQDNDRGIIVGRRSFGKGLVQQEFDMPDRSAVRLTVARYYTPSGRCIQRPYDRGSDEYYADFIQHIVDEYNNDSILSQINDSTPYYTAKGRIVYGGGGIYPDHTIHYKTDKNIVYYNQLISKLIINDYVFDYISANIAKIKAKYPQEKDFVQHYVVSDAMLQDLFVRAEKAGIARDNKCISIYREEIRSRVKASIGNTLYSNAAFYAIQLKYDLELREALGVKDIKLND